MIKINVDKIKKWNEIEENHCRYFKRHIESELSNLLIEDNKYISKRKKPKTEEYITYYELNKSDRTEIEDIFNGHFSIKNGKSKFILKDNTQIKKILCGQLDNIIEIFKSCSLNKRIIEKIFNYKQFSSDKEWNRHKLITMMDINVCPYCNRQYITNYNKNKAKNMLTTADLDHFYSQKDYPYLALSLYNFIPSCQICNSRFKGDKNFHDNPHIYPYKEEFGDNAKFKIKIDTIDYLLGESNDFEIYLDVKQSKYKDKIEKSINTFHLDDVYKFHTDYIQEIIKKAIMYSDDKINEILVEFPDLFSSRDEIYRIIFGNYINKEDFNKRPLSKLTKDICEFLSIDIE